MASGSGWQPGPTNCKPREPEGGVHSHGDVAGRLLLCCSAPPCLFRLSNLFLKTLTWLLGQELKDLHTVARGLEPPVLLVPGAPLFMLPVSLCSAQT